MAENKKIKKCPVSLQPDIENLLQDLTPDDFASASSQEKEDFIQDRQSVSYWKDAWRRLLKKLGFDQEISDRVQYLIAHHHTYNNINEIDYQILVEADFLVNIMEDGLTKEAALKSYHSIFRTACGKMICREMFDI